MRDPGVRSLGWEDPVKEIATHFHFIFLLELHGQGSMERPDQRDNKSGHIERLTHTNKEVSEPELRVESVPPDSYLHISWALDEYLLLFDKLKWY